MKLWKVTRTDSVQYEEYIGFVIRAKNEEEAKAIAQKESDGSWTTDDNVKVEEISAKGDAGVILDSYNAG